MRDPEVTIDIRAHPVVQRCWRVANVLEKNDATKKSVDGSPAGRSTSFHYDVAKVGFLDQAKYVAIMTDTDDTHERATVN